MSEKHFWLSEITFWTRKCHFLYVKMFLKASSVFFEVEPKARLQKGHEKINRNRHKKCQNFTQSDFRLEWTIFWRNGPQTWKIGLGRPILTFFVSIPIDFLPELISYFYIWSKISLNRRYCIGAGPKNFAGASTA